MLQMTKHGYTQHSSTNVIRDALLGGRCDRDNQSKAGGSGMPKSSAPPTLDLSAGMDCERPAYCCRTASGQRVCETPG